MAVGPVSHGANVSMGTKVRTDARVMISVSSHVPMNHASTGHNGESGAIVSQIVPIPSVGHPQPAHWLINESATIDTETVSMVKLTMAVQGNVRRAKNASICPSVISGPIGAVGVTAVKHVDHSTVKPVVARDHEHVIRSFARK